MEPEVRIERLGPLRTACAHSLSETPEEDVWKRIGAWAKPKGLLEEGVGTRIFGRNTYPTDNHEPHGYELFITEPEKTLTNVLEFLDTEAYEEFFRHLPKLKKDNFDKWKREFTKDQLNEIHPILTSKLLELGYENRSDWHQLADFL